MRRLFKPLCLMFVGMIAGIMLTTSPQPFWSVVSPPKVHQNALLLKDAQKLGIDVTGLNLYYEAPPGGWKKGQMGIFTSPNKIFIKPNKDDYDRLRLVAHEYIHFKAANEDVLTPETIKSFTDVYKIDYKMQTHMDWYLKQGLKPGTREFTNELVAVYCTERAAWFWPELPSWCGQLVPNISAIPDNYRW